MGGVWYDVFMDVFDDLDIGARRELRVKQLEAMVRRRGVLAAALTPEVLDALEEFLGVKDVLWAFNEGEGGTDALAACRRDTLMGVVRALRWEVSHVEEGEAALELARKEVSHG